MRKTTTLAASILLSLNLLACSHSEHHDNNEYHIGAINSEQLLNNYPVFAQAKSANENPATKIEIAQLAKQLEGKTLKVFFGTWCHDSQREIPRLLNLIEQVKLNHPDTQFNIEMIAVAPIDNRDQHIVEHFKVRYVPSIILYDGKTEIGRITETAQASLAVDLNAMKL